jgi:hypothetical protein
MKLPSILLGASFALALPFAAHANATSSRNWLEYYYQHPEPTGLVNAVEDLSKSGYFDESGHAVMATGFFAQVFAQNPDKVEGWMSKLKFLPESHTRILALALWKAGNPLGAKILQSMSQSSSNAGIAQMASKPGTAVANTPVLSASSMNLQWGAFLATGDMKYIVNILAAIGTGQPGLDEAARFALAKNAATHPLVMDICRSQLSSQPEQVQKILSAAIDDASASAAVAKKPKA